MRRAARVRTVRGYRMVIIYSVLGDVAGMLFCKAGLWPDFGVIVA